METVRIESAHDLIASFNSLENCFVYRGHADAGWSLTSALERVIGANWSSDQVTKFEDFSLQVFRSKFHLYDQENLTPDSKLSWLALMQHYGVPTRLVDFTESPYVALYFALEAYQPASQADFAVYALDYSAMMTESIAFIAARDASFKLETRASLQLKQDQVFDDVVDRFAYDIAWITEPKNHNRRLDRQGGCFLVAGNRELRIEQLLLLPLYNKCRMKKFVIPAELYPAIFALLRKMNVTSKSLYGDLDGLARAIRMEMQVYSVA